MSETKFTPGPWKLDQTIDAENGHYYITSGEEQWGAGSKWIASAEYRSDIPAFPLPEQARYNAFLISAAPEMYALLKDFFDNYEFGDVVDRKICNVLGKAVSQ